MEVISRTTECGFRWWVRGLVLFGGVVFVHGRAWPVGVRERFRVLVESGWSARRAALVVGVGVSTGSHWCRL